MAAHRAREAENRLLCGPVEAHRVLCVEFR